MVQTILVTQSFKPEEVGDKDKQKVIVALAAGMIAGVADQKTPFKDLSTTKTLPGEVLNAIVSAAIDIANKPEYSKLTSARAMNFGIRLGNNARDELHKNQKADPDTLITKLISTHLRSHAESIVPFIMREELSSYATSRPIIQQLSSSLKRTRSMTTPRSSRSPGNSTPKKDQRRKSGRSFP